MTAPALHPAHAAARAEAARDISDVLWDRILEPASKSDPLTVKVYLEAPEDFQHAIRGLSGHPASKARETWAAAIRIVQDRIEARIGTRFTWHAALPCPTCEGFSVVRDQRRDVTSPCGYTDHGVIPCDAEGCLDGHVACDMCGEDPAVLTVGRFCPLEVCESPGCVADAVEMAADSDVVANEHGPAAPAAEVVDGVTPSPAGRSG